MILPTALLSSLEGLPGYDRAAFEAVHAAGEQVTSIRVNPGKMDAERVPWSDAERVPWSSFGYYLPARPSFTFDPLLHAGAYYVQEASSMYLEQALRQTADLSGPLRVLDLCAAPGGKSTLLQSLLSADSVLVSNEVIRNRVHILEENMTKWGAPNTVVTSNDPQDFRRLENYFDVLVVDAPCSGSGLFRRDPDAVTEWSRENVSLCHQRQRRILADSWPALRRDGILIYSTCSYSREENEAIADWIVEELGAATCRLEAPADWGIVEATGRSGAYGYRFYPDKVRGEGLYIACFRKEGGEASFIPPRIKGNFDRLTRKEEESPGGWIRPEAQVEYMRREELVYCLAAGLMAALPVLQSGCYIRRAGIPMGKLSVKELIPEHGLALSTVISPSLPAVNVTREQALQYLRKDELRLDELRLEAGLRGWALVRYEGYNLGWVKVLPGRINNYYPKEWRILRREP